MTTYFFRGAKRTIPPAENHCICGKKVRKRSRATEQTTAAVLARKPELHHTDNLTGIGIFYAVCENA